MQKIKKILFATDFSENSKVAFDYALHFISENEVYMEVLHVVPPIFEPVNVPIVDNLNMKAALGEAVLEMKSFVQTGIVNSKIPKEKILSKIQTNIEIGESVKTIERIVKRDDIKMLIIGTRGKSNDRLFALGSVSSGLVGKMPTDILVVPQNVSYNEIKKIAYATLHTHTDPFNIWQAKKVFNDRNIEIECIHVTNDTISDSIREKINDLKTYFAENASDTRISFSIEKGAKVAKTLLDFSKNNNIDAIVLSKTKKSLVESLIHRSTTKDLLGIAEFPLLILSEIKK